MDFGSGDIRMSIAQFDTVVELGGGDTPVFCRANGMGVNVDVREHPNVDVIADLNKPLPLPDQTFTLAFSRYSIEHISWRNVPTFVNELYRILKPGGRVVIIAPNLYEQCKVVAGSKTWNDNFPCMIFGDQNYGENSHTTGFSPESIRDLFKRAGFIDISVFPHPSCATDMILFGVKQSSWVKQ